MKLNVSILGLLCLALSTSAVAGGGASTRGGGERKGRDMRDLVDPGTCLVMRGMEFAGRRAHMLYDVLRSLEPANWVFATLLRHEIDSLRICMVNAPLVAGDIVTEDRASDIVGNEGQGSNSLIAIRRGSLVRISQPEFEQLTPLSRGMLLVHEAMHAYVRFEEEGETEHNTKVRNIVRAIAENLRLPMSPESFQLQLDYSSACVPSLNAYAPFKWAFMWALADGPSTVSKQAALRAILTADIPPQLGGAKNFVSMTGSGCGFTLGGAAIAKKIYAIAKQNNAQHIDCYY